MFYILIIWSFSITVGTPIILYRKQYKRIWKNHIEIWYDQNFFYYFSENYFRFVLCEFLDETLIKKT